MELLCLGDIGFVDEKLENHIWPYPIKGAPEEDVRVSV